MKPKILTSLVLISVIFYGCHLFDLKKVTPQEIELASSWTENDQAPNFLECESVTGKENQKMCFETIVSNAILDYLQQNPLQSSIYFEEEVELTLRIDSEGIFELELMNYSDVVKKAIPNLEETMQNAVSRIPQAQPAIKTNVGTFVTTRFILPVMIYAE